MGLGRGSAFGVSKAIVAQGEMFIPMRRIIAWGSYDTSKPRVRLLLDSLRNAGALAAEINIPAWHGIRDKTAAGPGRLAKAAIRLLLAYPGALIRLARAPRSSAILLAYPAIPDVFVAWPIARLRGQRIVFDAFIPLHDTLTGDRALVTRNGWAAKAIWRTERAALRLADIILVDTDPHGDFYAREFDIPKERFHTVLVGAEPVFWSRPTGDAVLPKDFQLLPRDRPIILFYGQLSPLHGLAAMAEAIRLTAGEHLHWLLIGTGQEDAKLRRALDDIAVDHMTWLSWVEYGQLPGIIRASAVGLGVFGSSDKAARVIPNKLFQILAAGKPVITRSSPAVDPIAERYPNALITVPPDDGPALAAAIRAALENLETFGAVPPAAESELGPASGVRALLGRGRQGTVKGGD